MLHLATPDSPPLWLTGGGILTEQAPEKADAEINSSPQVLQNSPQLRSHNLSPEARKALRTHSPPFSRGPLPTLHGGYVENTPEATSSALPRAGAQRTLASPLAGLRSAPLFFSSHRLACSTPPQLRVKGVHSGVWEPLSPGGDGGQLDERHRTSSTLVRS